MGAGTWRFKDEQGGEREATTSDLRALLVNGALLPSTQVWRDGMKEWVPAFTLPEFATAAIAAARRETPHVPTLRPDDGGAPPPAPLKRKPMKTLVGIDSVEAQKAKTALEDTEPQRGGASGAIPPAPRVPKLDAPVRASAAVASAAASLVANGGGASAARPKSIPPPLPPRGPRSAAPPAPPAPPKKTLVGGGGPQPSRPPPPPPKGASKPPPPPARGQTMQMPAVPPRREVPSPPKRQQSTPPDATPGTLAAAHATPPAPLVAPTKTTSPAAESPLPPKLAEKTEKLPATPGPDDDAKQETTTTGQRPLLGAAQLLATLGDDWEEENTVQMARANGELVHSPRTPRPPPPDAAPTLKNAAKTAQLANGDAAKAEAPKAGVAKADAPKAVAAKGDAKARPAEAPAPVAKAAAAEAAKAAPPEAASAEKNGAATAGEDDDLDAKKTAELPRQKTLEMSLVDHEGAAKSSPVPDVGERRARSEAPAKRLPPSSPPPPVASADRASLHDGRASLHDGRASLSGEEGRRRHEAVEVPRRSIVGASLLWMVGLVTFFFVGRCAGYKKASQLNEMQSGVARTLLVWGPAGQAPPSTAVSSEPKPCWVSRQPTRWAAKASKSVPIDMAPSEGLMYLGYAIGDHEGVGIVIDPKTGKFEEKLRQKSGSKDKDIARVSPAIGSASGFLLSEKSERDVLPVSSSHAGAGGSYFLVIDKDSVGFAPSPTDEAKPIWKLPGEGDVSSEEVDETTSGTPPTPTGYFLTFRRGNSVYGGFFGLDKIAQGELSVIPPSGAEAKVGKPKSAFNGAETAVVFADLPSGKGDDWQVRYAHAKLGTVPNASDVLVLPEGGPGGRKIAPDIVGLPDGRWLVMWTEGPPGGSAIRALTFTKDFAPIGDPIALSPPAGNFGQAVLGSVGDYTTVVFLQAGDEGFELWGAVLRCG